VTLTITLDEDFDALCGTRADEQRLREANYPSVVNVLLMCC